MANTTINGTAYDHSNVRIVCTFDLGSSTKEVVLTEVTELSYSNNKEGGHLSANGQVGPVATVDGPAKPSWSGKCSRRMFDAVAAAVGSNFTQKPCTIKVLITKSPLPKVVDTILGAKWDKDGMGSSAGAEANMVEIGGVCLKVLPNGVDPFDAE